MISELYLFESRSFDPYYNQAIEEYLLDHADAFSMILYLWQNENTVFIGRNQSARIECRLDELKKDGGLLARRISGGGAVYHDLGNLNFTFLSSDGNYDIARDDEVIMDAVRSYGVDVEKSGRNDLLCRGRKFSGHAYYKGGRNCFHHGTIMVDVAAKKMERYLNVSMLKLDAKSVRSVRSRVVNLKELIPQIDVSSLKKRIGESFSRRYGLSPVILEEKDLDEVQLERLRSRYADEKWIMREDRRFPLYKERYSPEGLIRVEYELDGDLIRDIAVYTDALYARDSEELRERFTGRRIDELEAEDKIEEDIIDLLKEEEDEI